jgi:acetyl esterase
MFDDPNRPARAGEPAAGLDPFAEGLLGGLSALPASAADVEDARAGMLHDTPAVAGPPVAVAEVRDVDAAGVPARLYRPASASGGALLFMHGGGWALGSVETHDGLCREIANGSGATVLSVDYRLAPEYPYPAALDDCDTAWYWLRLAADELAIDADRVALGGDSAGGALAAGLALRLRDRGEPPARLQLLLYPCVDPALESASAAEFADGFRLTRANMRWFWHAYLGADAAAPEAAPALAEDLSGLPPALVITASHDVLRDEGEAYGARLRAANVPAEVVRVDGTLHGFLRFAEWPAARATRALLCERLRSALA